MLFQNAEDLGTCIKYAPAVMVGHTWGLRPSRHKRFDCTCHEQLGADQSRRVARQQQWLLL